MCPLGLSTLEKPLELSSHPDRQPERGALGWNLPPPGGVYMGLATLEKPLELNQKNSSVLLESSRLSF